MLLYSLNRFEPANESNRRFLTQLVDTLRYQVYESESFDEHLNFPEYLILIEVTQRLAQLTGKDLSAQAIYLERKVFNYS